MTLDCEMVQKALNVVLAEPKRMLLLMEKNELPGPVAISLNRSDAEVSTAAYDAELIEKFGLLVSCGCTQTWSLLM